MNMNNVIPISIKASELTKERVNTLLVCYEHRRDRRKLKPDADAPAELLRRLIDIGHGINSLGDYISEEVITDTKPWQPAYAILVSAEVLEKLAVVAMNTETSIEAYAGACLRRAVDALTAWHAVFLPSRCVSSISA